MKWGLSFNDPQQVGRDVAIRLFHILEGRLTADFSTYTAAIQKGGDLDEVFQLFVSALQDQLRQLQAQIVKWQESSQAQQSRAELLAYEIEQLRTDPACQRLGETREDLRKLTALVKTTQRDLVFLQNTQNAERESHQREITSLQQVIAAQNQIIAKQQLRLNQLAGGLLPGDPPSSERRGAQS